jgi:hypothetical protein
MRAGPAVCCALTGLILIGGAAFAQDTNDIVNIFGGMVQTVISRAAQAEWQKLPPAELACVDRNVGQRGSSLNLAIQQGIPPSDMRVSDARSACRNQVAQQPQAYPQQAYPQYVIDNIYLGGRVQFGSPSYREYRCLPSEQFAGFVYCQKQRLEKEARGSYTSSYSLLHSGLGTAVYINRFLEPAFFDGDEARADVDRLSKRFGSPRIIPMPRQSGVPNGLIASWGSVILDPLDAGTARDLAEGREVRVGFMIDHIGNLRRSARQGLPVYRLRGGAGYVWAASWNQYGTGTLQLMTVDASAFSGDAAQPPVNESSVASARPAAPPEEDPSKAAAEKIAAEKAEADRLAAQKAAAEKAEADRLAAEKAAAERAEAARLAAEKAAADRAAAEQAAAERAARQAEIELARNAQLRQKGVAYAKASGTTWTITRKLNEMTDRTDITVESLQRNEQGAVVEVQGYCKNKEVSFSALVIDADGKPTVSVPGRTSFGNDVGYGVPVLYRVNDNEPRNTLVPELEFWNKLQLAILAEPAGKTETYENTRRLVLSVMGVNIFLKAADAWRVMVELQTGAGPIILKIPLFDENIQELLQTCR